MITMTLLTQHDCAWCVDGRQLLVELGKEFPLIVEEVDLDSTGGRLLATEHRLVFAPGLIADGQLIAHGRLSKRALRRVLNRFTTTN